MKEAVSNVIDTVSQEDFHGAFQHEVPLGQIFKRSSACLNLDFHSFVYIYLHGIKYSYPIQIILKDIY